MNIAFFMKTLSYQKPSGSWSKSRCCRSSESKLTFFYLMHLRFPIRSTYFFFWYKLENILLFKTRFLIIYVDSAYKSAGYSTLFSHLGCFFLLNLNMVYYKISKSKFYQMRGAHISRAFSRKHFALHNLGYDLIPEIPFAMLSKKRFWLHCLY